MQATYEFRQKYIAIGQEQGYAAGLQKAADMLEQFAAQTDAEQALQACVISLQQEISRLGEPKTKAAAQPITDERAEAMIVAAMGAKHVQPARDLGDEVAALMAAKRGKSLSSQPASTRRDSSIIDWSTR